MTDNRDQFIPEDIPETGEALYISFEKKTVDKGVDQWILGLSNGESYTKRRINYRNYDQLSKQVNWARSHFGLSEEFEVYSVYEMGREGFSMHRKLVERGIKNLPIDASSTDVKRKKREAKTDKIDAMKLVRHLVRFIGGDHEAFNVVNVPSPEVEDRRELSRERDTLIEERSAHINRIRGLLFKHGVNRAPSDELIDSLDELETSCGNPLGEKLKKRIRREYRRLQLVNDQLEEVNKEQKEEIKLNKQDPMMEMAIMLMRLKSINVISAYKLVTEAFGWREFQNRGEVKGCFGTDATPFESGDEHREQGISKAGNSRLRGLALEIAWNWRRYQPDSELTRWFFDRWDGESDRQELVLMVALASKLMNRLYRFARYGEVPNGSVMSTSPPITMPDQD